ncbi:hypothetical protein [Amycolatopsis balhimycina]|nr:hypothetical protein [Amycolatopsis balhimycina]
MIQPVGLDLADAWDFARMEAKIAAGAPDVVIAGGRPRDDDGSAPMP